MLGGAPVAVFSKVTSVCMDHKSVKENHADVSSAAAEVYAVGNVANELLGQSYAVDEMGMNFPATAILQVDNTTAISFSGDSCQSTKLKHIDARQEWVRALRDSNVMVTVHVPSKQNLADFFTKVLDKGTFQCLRDQITMDCFIPPTSPASKL
jgi:hypothetical protein